MVQISKLIQKNPCYKTNIKGRDIYVCVVDKKRPKRTDILLWIDKKDLLTIRSPLRLYEEIKNLGASPDEVIQVMNFMNDLLRSGKKRV
jgi:hypothetical protein